MWERSPTARLIWGVAFAASLAATGSGAAATGNPHWIGVFLLVLAIGATQLLGAGPAHGRLWDSPLTKVLYLYVALWAVYLFGSAAVETGNALAIVLLAAIVGLLAAQWGAVLLDRRSA